MTEIRVGMLVEIIEDLHHVIETIQKQGKDCYGNPCRYGVYVYMGKIK